jgi:hypothetical protein
VTGDFCRVPPQALGKAITLCRVPDQTLGKVITLCRVPEEALGKVLVTLPSACTSTRQSFGHFAECLIIALGKVRTVFFKISFCYFPGHKIHHKFAIHSQIHSNSQFIHKYIQIHNSSTHRLKFTIHTQIAPYSSQIIHNPSKFIRFISNPSKHKFIFVHNS